jgi:hypothetical protein
MTHQKKLLEVPPKPNPSLPKDPIEEMVGALTDPLIVFPSGWEDTIPQHLKERLPLDRLAHQMRCMNGQAHWDEATDLEALLYMYPASLAHPLSEQWTRIYLYLGTRCLGDKLPEDSRQESLSDYDMAELRGLKRWIRKQILKARKDRKSGEKAEAVVRAKVEQPRLF